MITPNRQEFERAVGEQLGIDEIEARAVGFLETYSLDALLVTLGDKGMELVTSEGKSFRIGSQAREVFDVSGAGDTVIAVMAMAMDCGLDLLDAVKLANSAAGVVVSKSGTATLTTTELISVTAGERAE